MALESVLADFVGLLGASLAFAEPLKLPLERLNERSWFDIVLNYPLVKSLLPFPLMVIIAVPVWLFFRGTWQELDAEAREHRKAEADDAGVDYRPAACLLITAAVLTIQEYYGGRGFYDQVIKPALSGWESGGAAWVKLKKYDEFYGYCWWSFSRVAGYVLVPFPVWKILFPKDSLLDMGLRLRGLLKHSWIYGLCLLVIIPTTLVAATQPDFGSYYPFYKNSSRSWFDFLIWQSIYWAQFLALELFFRGWMLGAMRRTLGAAAIFVMAVPYCMIHYGKPYLEAHGAVIAGVVLGSLAMKTRSIYSGFLVHITVAFLMDFLALYKRGALPDSFWAGG